MISLWGTLTFLRGGIPRRRYQSCGSVVTDLSGSLRLGRRIQGRLVTDHGKAASSRGDNRARFTAVWSSGTTPAARSGNRSRSGRALAGFGAPSAGVPRGLRSGAARRWISRDLDGFSALRRPQGGCFGAERRGGMGIPRCRPPDRGLPAEWKEQADRGCWITSTVPSQGPNRISDYG